MFSFRRANGIKFIVFAPILFLLACGFWQGVHFSILSTTTTGMQDFCFVGSALCAIASVLSLLLGIVMALFGKSEESKS